MSTRARATSMRAIRHGQQRTQLARILQWLYGAGEQGIAVPDLTPGNGFLFQDSAGTTPVTAYEQPVGLILDRRSTPYSVFFDGTGDRLTCGASSVFDLSTAPITFEYWIYPLALPGAGNECRLLMFGPNNFTSSLVAGQITSDGVIALYIPRTGAAGIGSPSNTVTLNVWQHFAFVLNGANSKIYRNGVEVASGTVTQPTATSGNGCQIGYDTAGTVNFNYNGYISNLRVVKGTAVYTANFTPPTSPLTAVPGTILLTCGTTWSGNPAITNNGDTRADKLNPFTTGTGNHIIQATSTKRPTLSARYNLLTYTEDFSNAAWPKFNTTVTANTTVAPDGTTTADSVFETTTNAGHSVYQVYSSASGITYTISWYVKANGRNYAFLRASDANANAVSIDFVNKTAVNASGTTTNISCTEVANGFLRVSFTFVSSGTGGIECSVISSTDGVYANRSYAGDVTKGFIAWGADFRRTIDTIGQPAYQRVGASNDYDTAGFFPYLAFDGTDDSMATAASVDFTGTDKVSVVAGITRLSDQNPLVLFEHSNDSDSNNGVFQILAPHAPDGFAYRFLSRGTTARFIGLSPVSAAPAPDACVITAQSNISASTLTLRRNGAQVASGVSSQGTGNFGSYSFNLGSRGGSSLFFSGRLYPFFIRGAATDAGLIAQVEQYIRARIPVNF